MNYHLLASTPKKFSTESWHFKFPWNSNHLHFVNTLKYNKINKNHIPLLKLGFKRKVLPGGEAFSTSVYKSTYSGLFILSENFGFFTTFLKKKKRTRIQNSDNWDRKTTLKEPWANKSLCNLVKQIRSNNSKQDKNIHYHYFIFLKLAS